MADSSGSSSVGVGYAAALVSAMVVAGATGTWLASRSSDGDAVAQPGPTGQGLPLNASKPTKRAKADTAKHAKPSAIPLNAPRMLVRVGQMSIPGAEIVTFDKASKRVFVTSESGIGVVAVGTDGVPALSRMIDVVTMAGLPAGVAGSVTHVAVDPAGRGFAAATVVPAMKARIPGTVVFFSIADGTKLAALPMGHNPDAVALSADGARGVVVNEGEAEIVNGSVVDPPGSISVIDLAGVHGLGDFQTLSPGSVTTLGFAGGAINAAYAKMRSGQMPTLRINPAWQYTPNVDIEPESVCMDANRAFITLQENAGVAVCDLTTSSWTALAAFPPVMRTIDASDKDGGVHVDDEVLCLPMPDQLASFKVGDRVYLALCEEGDDHGDADDSPPSPLADQARLGWLANEGRLDPAFIAAHDMTDSGIGRLKVCAFTGDSNNDGKLDHPVVLGTRSMSVIDAATLARVGDTGSQFEQWLAERAPGSFNADSKNLDKPDVRSPTRGPEPEGIAIGTINGRPMAFVGLERPGAICVIDLKDPANPKVLDILVTALEGDLAPEGMCFIGANDSPTGEALLLAAFEGSGSLAVYRISPVK